MMRPGPNGAATRSRTRLDEPGCSWRREVENAKCADIKACVAGMTVEEVAEQVQASKHAGKVPDPAKLAEHLKRKADENPGY